MIFVAGKEIPFLSFSIPVEDRTLTGWAFTANQNPLLETAVDADCIKNKSNTDNDWTKEMDILPPRSPISPRFPSLSTIFSCNGWKQQQQQQQKQK